MAKKKKNNNKNAAKPVEVVAEAGPAEVPESTDVAENKVEAPATAEVENTESRVPAPVTDTEAVEVPAVASEEAAEPTEPAQSAAVEAVPTEPAAVEPTPTEPIAVEAAPIEEPQAEIDVNAEDTEVPSSVAESAPPKPVEGFRFGHSHSHSGTTRCECEDLMDAIAAGPSEAEAAALEASRENMFQSPFVTRSHTAASSMSSLPLRTTFIETSQASDPVSASPGSFSQRAMEATSAVTASSSKLPSPTEDTFGDTLETPLKSRYRIPARRAKTEDSVIPLYTERQQSVDLPETPTNPNAYRIPARRQRTEDKESASPTSEEAVQGSSTKTEESSASVSPLTKSIEEPAEPEVQKTPLPHVKKDSLISDSDQGLTKSPVDMARPEIPPTAASKVADDAASVVSGTPSQPAPTVSSDSREQQRSRRDVPRRFREPSLERAISERERHQDSAILTDDEDADPRAAFRARYRNMEREAVPPQAPTAPHSPTMRSARPYAEPAPSDNPPRYYPPPTAAHLPYPGYYAQHRHNMMHPSERDMTPPYHNAGPYRGMDESYASDSSGSRGLVQRDEYMRGGPSRYHMESDDPADLLGKIASTIPDIQRLMHRYYETQGKLSEREERMREAEMRQEEILRKQEVKLIDQSEILSDLRKELENTRDRHETDTGKLRDRILEAELKRKDLEAAKSQAVAQIETLEKERQALHQAIPEERERMMQEFEDWKANAKAEAEAQQMAIAQALLDKQQEHENELAQKLEEAKTEYETKVAQLQEESAKAKADSETQVALLQDESAKTKADLEAQVSALQADLSKAADKEASLTAELEDLRATSEETRATLQSAVDNEREQHANSRTKWDAENHQLNEDWAAEMEALKNALHEEHETYKNDTNEAHTKALNDTHESHTKAINDLNDEKTKELDDECTKLRTTHAAEKAEVEENLTNQLNDEKERCRLEVEDVHRRWIEDKERFDKTLGELRSVMQNIGNERGRLQKLIDGTGGFNELKSKGDAF